MIIEETALRPFRDCGEKSSAVVGQRFALKSAASFDGTFQSKEGGSCVGLPFTTRKEAAGSGCRKELSYESEVA